MTNQNCYFYSTIAEFLKTSDSDILESLKEGAYNLYKKTAEDSQIRAWNDEISVLKNAGEKLPGNWIIIFEYILPREGGRRPDIIILTGNEVLVLEFKQFEKEHWSHMDQVTGYARDLREYHSYCHDKEVIPFLILTKAKDKQEKHREVQVLSPDTMVKYLLQYKNEMNEIEPIPFIEGVYQPLPTIIDAAKNIFNNEPLPQIKTAKSSNIEETLAFLQEKSDEAITNHKNLLMFVTGVPGAGKTLVGLQFTYNNLSHNAIMLSGNGPLIKVLQSCLENKVGVQLVYNYLDDYNRKPQLIPAESIITYDEAQRAWDEKHSLLKKRECSEHDNFMRLAKRRSLNGKGTVIIGLIGEGQSIYVGEEGGIELWNTAIKNSELEWQICCPKHLASFFENPIINEELNLSISLRSKSALQLPNWIEAVIEGNSQKAKEIHAEICNEYPIYITRDFNQAKDYIVDRYKEEVNKRYGLIISSQANIISRNDESLKEMRYKDDNLALWFLNGKNEKSSCCNFEQYITEFVAQGLELDFPLICWGKDFIRFNTQWRIKGYDPGFTDPKIIKQNVYRVLLSRGREGMFIYVPRDPIFNDTHDFLRNCIVL